jgi:hypothetical protein
MAGLRGRPTADYRIDWAGLSPEAQWTRWHIAFREGVLGFSRAEVAAELGLSRAEIAKRMAKLRAEVRLLDEAPVRGG